MRAPTSFMRSAVDAAKDVLHALLEAELADRVAELVALLLLIEGGKLGGIHFTDVAGRSFAAELSADPECGPATAGHE